MYMFVFFFAECAELKPPVDEIVNQCRNGVLCLVDKLIERHSVSEGEAGHLLSVQICCVLKDVKGSIATSPFFECILSKLAEVLNSKEASKVMPSALRSVMQSALTEVYSSKIFQEQIMAEFLKLTAALPALAWNIIYLLIKEIFENAFIEICKKLRGPAIEACKIQSKDDFNHHSSQQVSH